MGIRRCGQLALLLLCYVSLSAQHGPNWPTPPRSQDTGTSTSPSLKRPPGVRVAPAQLKEDGDELSKLAQSVPSDLEQVSKGLLPTELEKKLKRIEKLSKKIRNEISLH